LSDRESERFPTCNPFKVPATGALLVRVDAGREAEMTLAICSLRRLFGGQRGRTSNMVQSQVIIRQNLHIEISDFISVAVDAFALST
jgi:hypothetical protein